MHLMRIRKTILLPLKELIRQTIFTVNDADKNKILTGELFEVMGNRLKVVALDKFRIAIRNMELKEDYGNFKVLVPGKSLNEISKILNGGDPTASSVEAT